MVENMVKATEAAKASLADIREMKKNEITVLALLPLLRKAIFQKLMIPEQEESNLRNLVVISIKTLDAKSGNLSDAVIQKQIKKYDCHQTSLVAQKKVLLLMFIERELGISMNDDDASSIETIEDLARFLVIYLKNGRAV